MSVKYYTCTQNKQNTIQNVTKKIVLEVATFLNCQGQTPNKSLYCYACYNKIGCIWELSGIVRIVRQTFHSTPSQFTQCIGYLMYRYSHWLYWLPYLSGERWWRTCAVIDVLNISRYLYLYITRTPSSKSFFVCLGPVELIVHYLEWMNRPTAPLSLG